MRAKPRKSKLGGYLLVEQPECEHTPGKPSGLDAFMEWADEMDKTHVQTRCPICGLWSVWIPKDAA